MNYRLQQEENAMGGDTWYMAEHIATRHCYLESTTRLDVESLETSFAIRTQS